MSASDAAEDRARGVKREGGVIVDGPKQKSTKIEFVKQGQSKNSEEIEIPDSDEDSDAVKNNTENVTDIIEEKEKTSAIVDARDYLNDMLNMKCLDIRSFNDRMFHTPFGRMVLLVRPWTSKLCNIQCKF